MKEIIKYFKDIIDVLVERIFIGPLNIRTKAEDGTFLYFTRSSGSELYDFGSADGLPIIRPDGTRQYWRNNKLLCAKKTDGTVLHYPPLDAKSHSFSWTHHSGFHVPWSFIPFGGKDFVSQLDRAENRWNKRENPDGSITEVVDGWHLRTTHLDGWVERTHRSGKPVYSTDQPSRYNTQTGRKEWFGSHGQMQALEENSERFEYHYSGQIRKHISVDGAIRRYRDDGQMLQYVSADGVNTRYDDAGMISSVAYPDGNKDLYYEGKLLGRVLSNGRHMDFEHGMWKLRPTLEESDAAYKSASDAFDEAVTVIARKVLYGGIDPSYLTTPDETARSQFYHAGKLPQFGHDANNLHDFFNNSPKFRDAARDLLSRSRAALSSTIHHPGTTLASTHPVIAERAAAIRPLISAAENKLEKLRLNIYP